MFPADENRRSAIAVAGKHRGQLRPGREPDHEQILASRLADARLRPAEVDAGDRRK